MYKYESALALGRTIGAQWHTVDLENILVYDIFNNYTQVFLTLSNIYLDAPVYVNMNTLRARYSSYNGMLKQLLIDLGSETLSTVESLPNATVRYAKYSDAFYSGYKVDTTKIGVGNTNAYTPSELVDLKITRPGTDTDMSLIHDYCLVTVNGYIHRTDSDGINTYVYEGRKSLARCRENQAGILSFLDIGKLKQVPIAAENIYAQDTDSDLKTRTYFWVNEDLTNKSVALVLGGYLIFPEENIFWQTSERTFAINFNAMPLIERIFESNMYLDFTFLDLDRFDNIPDLMSVPELLSDETLKKYMTMSQSFLVVIDAPYVFHSKTHIRNCNLPGMFTAFENPTYPLFVNYGKIAEYWKTHEDGQWSVTVRDSFLRNFVLSSRPDASLQVASPAGIPGQTFYHSRGYMMQIGAYK